MTSRCVHTQNQDEPLCVGGNTGSTKHARSSSCSPKVLALHRERISSYSSSQETLDVGSEIDGRSETVGREREQEMGWSGVNPLANFQLSLCADLISFVFSNKVSADISSPIQRNSSNTSGTKK